MFKRLRLGNFKRFQRTEVNLRAVNVIVGPNNSGKSSLMAAFRLACQTLDSYDEQVSLLLNGPFGDFGTFKDLVYRNHRGRPLEMEFDFELPGLNMGDPEVGLATVGAVFKYSQEDREIYAQSVEVSLNGEALISLQYSREGRRYLVERLGAFTIAAALKNVVSREFRVRHFFPVPLSSRLGVFDRYRKSAYGEFLEEFNASPSSDVIRKLLRIWGRLTGLISRTDYLGPLRTAPARTYLFTGERSRRIGSGGENLMSMLATRDRKRDREKDGDGRPMLLQERINAWLQGAEMAKRASLVPISDRHFEIRIQNFFTKEDQNIADVGFGHSQVLPLLAGGYALGERSTYFVEQPELHLHPKAQSELGDFFFDMYSQGTQVFVETHSEHLILRLQQHVAAGNIKHEDVRIFYICNDTDQSQAKASAEITEINIDRAGQFTRSWPRGFFPEKLEESKKLARLRFAQLDLEL